MKEQDANIIAMMSDKRSQEKGLRLLMDTYQNRLYWHIRRIVVGHEWAEDTLQEVFIKVFQNFNQFQQNSKLYTWLYRIATNEALQQLKKIKKIQTVDDESYLYMQNLVTENSETNADDIQILLQKAIQSLPEKQKLVFTMRYYDDLPYEEMSDILEMSVGTLKTNYHYAKQKIEDYIKENYEK